MLHTLLATLNICVAAAPAADWWLIGANATTATFVDRASLSRTAGHVIQRVAAVTPTSPVRRIEVVERLDCEARTAADLRIIYVLANGAQIEQAPRATQRMLRSGTIGQATLDFACGNDAVRAAPGTPIGSVSLEEVARRATSRG